MRRLPPAVTLFLLAIVASCADATRPIVPTAASNEGDLAIGVTLAAPTDGAASLVSTTTLTARTVPPGSGALVTFDETYATTGDGSRRYTGVNPSLYAQLIWAPTEVSVGFGSGPMRAIPLLSTGIFAVYRGNVPVQLASGPSQIDVRILIRVVDDQQQVLAQAAASTFASWGLPALTGTAWKVSRSAFEARGEVNATHPLVDGGATMSIDQLVQRLRDEQGLSDPLHVTINSQFFYAAEPCPAGQWGDGFNCGLTPAGSYAVVGAEQPAPCAAGTYQPMPGQVACLAAPAGSYVNTAGAIATIPCAVGSYQPNAGQITCFAAPPGRFVNTLGAAAAVPCAPGTYQPAAGASSCLPAPAGSFVDVPGAIASTPCPAARYQPNIGQIACFVTDPGYYVAGEGAITQLPCAAGTFAATQASASCTIAPAGHYVNLAAATSATPCALGSFQPQVGQIACFLAPAGRYVAITAATQATPCAAGSYNPLVGATSAGACLPAPAGTYVSVPGAASATPCAPGSYNIIPGSIACTLAEVGRYVPAAGAIASIPCPAGYTTLQVGSTACLAMIAQSMAFTSTPPSPAYEEGSYQLAATGGASGNAVTFSTSSAACSVGGTVVRLLAPGSCTIEAHQAGGGLYYPAPTATQSFTVVQLPADLRTEGMITQLQSLATGGALSTSDAQSLTALLQNAVQAFGRGSTQAGVNQVNAFINRVGALERSRRISSATAAALIAAARKTIAAAS